MHDILKQTTKFLEVRKKQLDERRREKKLVSTQIETIATHSWAENSFMKILTIETAETSTGGPFLLNSGEKHVSLSNTNVRNVLVTALSVAVIKPSLLIHIMLTNLDESYPHVQLLKTDSILLKSIKKVLKPIKIF